MKTPGISLAFEIFGWLLMIFCALGISITVGTDGRQTTDTAITMWGSGFLSGLILLAISFALDKLARIEHHLRPKEASASEKSESANAS
jgi:tellurite resistance protein TehA-like permease